VAASSDNLRDRGRLEATARKKIGPAAIIGTRIGSVIPHVFENTREMFLTYSDPIYLIEPDPAVFAPGCTAATTARC